MASLTQLIPTPPPESGCPRCRLYQPFVDKGSIGLRLIRSVLADLRKQARRDADGDQLLGLARPGPADATGASEFGIRGFRNVRKIELAIRCMLFVLSGSPAAH